MKMEALSHQGKRTDLTSAQVEPKLSAEIIGESEKISRETVKRYIRLTNLLPKLLEYVDEGRIAFTPAVELSYLDEESQRDVVDRIEETEVFPSHAQTIV
jgi:ParB family chromosome partitioning protein